MSGGALGGGRMVDDSSSIAGSFNQSNVILGSSTSCLNFFGKINHYKIIDHICKLCIFQDLKTISISKLVFLKFSSRIFLTKNFTDNTQLSSTGD